MMKKVIHDSVNVKKKGDCFGYDGLMNKKFRSSTVMTEEDTHFFVLLEDFFDKTFKKAILKADRERKDFLIERVTIPFCFGTRFKT